MNLIELGKIVNGNYTDKISKPIILCLEEDVEVFKELLSVDEKLSYLFKNTEVAKEFYEKAELFDKAIPDDIKEDVFYAVKNGFYYDGVPAKLVFILRKAIKVNKTPSLALHSINDMTWGNFLKQGASKHTIKEIIDALYGKKVTLISEDRLKIQHDNFTEIYVTSIDRVCLVPNDIADKFNTIEDLQNIKYVEGLGVCFEGIPLRTFNGRVGVVFDEFDLTKAE